MSFAAELQDPYVVGEDVATAALAAAPWRRFGALGDSLVAGAGDLIEGYRPVYWVDRVRDALDGGRARIDHLNVGERNSVIADILDAQLPRVLSFRPDLVLVDGGANDLFSGDFDLDVTAARLETLVGTLVSTGATVVTFTLFGMARNLTIPEPWGSRLLSRMDAWQATVRNVGRERGAHVIDFASHPAAGDPAMYSSDLIHLNTRGHAIAATAAVRFLASIAKVTGAGP
jgi:lysophospholipase L1-like esterase